MNVNDLIAYCSNNYINSYKKCRCEDCSNICQGSCEKCLETIHFGDNRRYNCQNMINYYVCKYTYKYSSEIAHVFFENKLIDEMSNINIVSIGCGPCTDLIGIKEYIRQQRLNIKINYTGVDLNKQWYNIHNFIKNSNDNIEAEFIYDDIFNVFENLNRDKKYDIVFLQYFLSDMIKYNDKNQMDKFVDNFVSKVVSKLKNNSLVIINDINYKNTRDYFDHK